MTAAGPPPSPSSSPPPPPPPPHGTPWLRVGAAVLALLYVGFWAAAGASVTGETDLDAFFFPSALKAASGDVFGIYSVRFMDYYPNANGPLSQIPLALVALALKAAGLEAHRGARVTWTMVAFSPFCLLMAREAVLACDRVLGSRLAGPRRLAAYAFFALSPLLRVGLAEYGHVELALVLWLVLWATRLVLDERDAAAGALLGLAMLGRTAASTYVAVLLVALLGQRAFRRAARLAAPAAAVGALGVAPFLLLSFEDTWYSLSRFHDLLPVFGGSFWGLAVGTRFEELAQRRDSLVVLAVAALAAAAVLRGRAPGPRELYGVLAVAALSFALFIKSLWPYHLLEPFVLAGICWIGARRRARSAARWWAGLLVPAALVAVSYLVWELQKVYGDEAVGKRPSAFVALVLAACFVAVLLPLRRGATAAPTPAPAPQAAESH